MQAVWSNQEELLQPQIVFIDMDLMGKKKIQASTQAITRRSLGSTTAELAPADYLAFMSQCGITNSYGGSSAAAAKGYSNDESDALSESDSSYDPYAMLCGKLTTSYPAATLDTITNCTDSTYFAVSTGTELYNHYLDSLKNSFDSLYHSKCLQAYNLESFTVTDTDQEYHYTLYYYDQAGNLIQTIPPAAVHPNWNSTYLAQVKAKRATGDTLRPGHNLLLATEYRYNTLNQVVSQHSPDGGTSAFWYDRLGRLALSQNARQAPLSHYSYTFYDAIGRITEVGELTNSSAMTNSVSKVPAQLQSWLTSAATSKTQITQTVYDIPYVGVDSVVLWAKNLRNRVSYMQYFNMASDQSSLTTAAGTYYSYDIEGNADTLVQDYTIASLPVHHNRFFQKMVYGYDLISGKVNTVDYNPGQPDAFHHRYTYDAENRITNVETSTDSIYWENEAFYKYYMHGPLARTVIGDQQVQGMDYAYTLQGWLKGINTSSTGTTFDMGNDGFNPTGGTHQDVGRDAIGYVLHYFGDSDYKAIAPNQLPFASLNKTVLPEFKPLYNGNIAAITDNQSSFSKALLFSYGYDQLNRLVQMHTFKNNTSSFTSTSNNLNPVFTTDYNEDIAYDPNGNILKYRRYGNSAWQGTTNQSVMDSLSYNYIPGTNQLKYIKDSVPATAFTVDIDNQPLNNYGYDAIGNMVKDSLAGIDSIKWTVYGKIQTIYKHNATVINYSYDASGNRISKVITGGTSGNGETWYVHDASGNVMSIYTVNDNTVNSGALTLTEQEIYGSSRVGMAKPGLNLANYTAPTRINMSSLGSVGYYTTFTRGKKFFELDNHLGNVLVTVTDKKFGVSTSNNSVVNYYTPDIVSAQDYYPGGMLLPGRDTNYKPINYRYSFNGKEQDPEVYGQGNEYDYGFRIYNPRIGRFLSADPLTQKYPNLTPYQFASNRSIDGIDRDGLEYINYIPRFNTSGRSFNSYVGAFDNGVIDILNVVPTLWNSGVSTVQSINRGTYGQDVNDGAKQAYSSFKSSAKQLYRHPLQTLTSPQALEFTVSLYVGSKLLPTGSKGNLLKPASVQGAGLAETEELEFTEETNSGNTIRNSSYNSKDYQIKSSHSYSRPHEIPNSGGQTTSFQGTGITMNQVETSIIKNIDKYLSEGNNLPSLSGKGAQPYVGEIEMGSKQIEYKAGMTQNGKIEISGYYLKK